MNRKRAGLFAGMLLCTAGAAQGQVAHSQPWASTDGAVVVSGCCSDTGTPPVLHAIRIVGDEITIDGWAGEDAWLRAPVATDFVQFEPGEGDPPSERTEARVLYGQDALFVAIRAFDTRPEEIVGQLTRRDEGSYSDMVGVVIDSYFDRRTAFHFAVNPVGVKHDIYRFDDTNEDQGWDAVWDVGTSRDEEGWTAEFRIPYSQLRFRDRPDQTWGINFLRDIARLDETVVWAPTTRKDAAIVSKFGELRGLTDLTAPSRMEILPYSLARLERAPGDAANPFYRANDGAGTVGADVKYGITSDLTLDLTVNPDFGQVEADPAQVNLTAFETFLPERRPFFVEGSSIFNFSIALGDGPDANESLFYSRRVGRAPQGWADPQGGFTDAADHTTIRGAWKLSGKTAGGWSIGAMHAVTARESARIAPAGGEQFDQAVEPASNYGVLRIQKDFREGKSALGIIGTGVKRSGDVADALALRSGALSGGVDFRHRFAGDRWEVRGHVLGSRVTGSPEAIARTQRSPARYYQRPDAGHLSYDPTRTELSGGAAFLNVGKIAGEHWRVSTGVQTRSPGFEVNDAGFMKDADYLVNWAWTGYQQTTPQGPFRRWGLNGSVFRSQNYDGDLTGLGGNVNGSFQLGNFWNGWGGVNRDLSTYSGRTLRGGPLFRNEAQTNFWGGVSTDSRKAVHVSFGLHGNVRPESDSRYLGLNPTVRIRPSGRATFSVGPSLSWNNNDRQWVGEMGSTEPIYVFGRVEQTTVGLTARVDYAFTPTLSLQLYAQPFVSAGSYSEYKRVTDPVADRYEDRFALLDARLEDGDVITDLDGDGTAESFQAPGFSFNQFRSNTVLRWEYQPGSTLFLVWSQGRDRFSRNGSFDLSGDMDRLFDVEPENVFMIKVSYWMSR